MVEQQRLAALRSCAILDTAPEEAFDRLTRLAADLYDAPIALVSLIDDARQWFKSRVGVTVSETPRAWAFCDHAIDLGPNATFVVEDASADERFLDNPLVTGESHIRFYAGAVLTTEGGENLGTLCVIDTKPRAAPSGADLRRLTTLAQVAVREIETRRTAARVEEKRRLLGLAEAMSGVGHWRLEAKTNRVTWSDEVYAIHGVAREAFDPNLGEAIGFYHPEDQARVAAFIERAIADQQPLDFRLRLNRADGALRHVQCKGECEVDAAGATLAVFGVFQDVTDHVQALTATETARREEMEKSRRSTLAEEIAGLGHWRLELKGLLLTWSDQMYALFGLDRASSPELETMLSLTHPEDREAMRRCWDPEPTAEAQNHPTIRLVRRDGAIVWVVSHSRVERDEAGRVCAIVGTLMDVTRETQAARRVAESEERYRLLTENSHDLVIKMSVDAVLDYVSPSISQLLGYRPEEMIGRCARDLVEPADLERCREQFKRALAGEEVPRADYRLRRKDGATIWVDARPRAVRSADTGEVVAVTDVIRDVTVRKAIEDALASSESRFRLLADNAGDIVTECDLTGVFRYVSPAVAAVTGYAAEEVIGQRAIDFVHPDDRDRVKREIASSLSARDGRQIEHRHVAKDGRVIWLQSRPRLALDGLGRPAAVTDVMRDVTERKAAEAAIVQSEARYRLLADNATDLVLKFDSERRIEYASPAARLLGYDPEDLIGLRHLDLVHPDDRDHARRLAKALIEGEDVSLGSRREYRFLRRDGQYVWLEGNTTLLRDEAGEIHGAVSAFRDVSARRALEDSLGQARSEAEAATAIKSEFLANMSHEIRTPLTAILGFTGLLADRNDLPETAKTMVSRVAGAGSALLNIVNDILDFSKLEAGQVSIDPRPVDVASLARDALAMFAVQAEAKSLATRFSAAPDLPPRVRLDPRHLQQLLFNLLGNAFKFTEAGEVAVRLDFDPAAETLWVRVEDTGPGMDESQRAHLFQRFSQVDASSTRRHGGTGLGLAICKGLAEAMGGGVSVESTPGRGSAFTVHVSAPPAAEPAQAEAEAEPGATLKDIRVLVADDKSANLELARALLEHFQAEVTEAVDGLDAVRRASEEPFDVILLDLHMPRLDGYGALARIRHEPGPNQHVPIFAFTADGKDTVDCPRHGFDGVIEKPISAAAMVSALIQATDWRESEDEAEAGYAARG